MNADARVWRALLLVMAMGLAARPSLGGAPPPPPPDCWKADPAPVLQIRLYLSPDAWDITSKTAYFAYTPWKNDLSDYGIEVHRHDSDTIYPQCGGLPGDSYSDSSWAQTELVNLAVPTPGTYEARGLFRDNTTPPFTPPTGTGQDGEGVQYERVATAKMIATTVSELDWLGVGETVEVTATVVPGGVNGSGDDNNYLWQQSGGQVLFVVDEEEVGSANGRTVTIIGKTPSPQMDGTYVAARFTTGEDDVGRTITTFYTNEYFTVVGVNLNIAGVSEAQEEEPGKFVGFNNDDDNFSGVPDYEESGPGSGENDLAALSLSYGPPDLNVGQVTLAAVSGGSRIKLWTTSTKGTRVSLPASWNLASESVPSTLYVEGVAPSGSVRDVGLKLSYNNGEAYHEDRVNLTVVETDLDIEQVGDENEANPGGFVGVNNDDDNDNGVEDKDPTEMTVAGEDNLVSIILACRPSSLDGASIKLEAPSGSSKIKLWTDATKGTEVPLWESPIFSPNELPKTLYVEGITASGDARDVELRVSCLIDGALKHQDKVKITVVDVSLAVEDNLTDCMEGRWVTFTATAHDEFPHGLSNPISFTFHYQHANGTEWEDTDWSTDLLEDNTAVADDVLDGDPDHYFTTPIYVEAENDTAQTNSNTIEVDVYELWIEYLRDHVTGKDWQVVVGQSIAYSAIASSGAKNFDWDMPDGLPDAWNPTGGNAKAGTNMVIPNSDLPDNNNSFGDSYGTVKVFCEDAEGGNNTLYSTSMTPAESAKVFFNRNSTGKTGTDPNWYYYWATDNGGPCQHRYSGTTSYEGATVTWDYNGGIPGTGQTTRHSATEYKIEVGATTPNARNWNFNSPRIPANGTFVDSQGIARFFPANNIVLNFVRANWEGIDSVEQTLKHEKQHVLHWRRWEPPEGYWYLIYGPRVTGNVPGNNDRDDDFLPNIFEDLSGTRFDQPRTFPGFYLGGDDDEVFCELQAGNASLSGNNDWAHSGKQWP